MEDSSFGSAQSLLPTQILNDLANGTEPDRLAEIVCSTAEGCVAGCHAVILVVNPEDRLEVFAAPTLPRSQVEALNALPAAEVSHLGGWWSRPIWLDNQVAGAFALSRSLPDPPDATMLEVLEFCTAMTGSILRYAKMQERVRQQQIALSWAVHFRTMLARVNHIAAQAEDPMQLLRDVCELVVHHAQGRLACIAIPDAEGWFRFPVGCGETAFLEGQKGCIHAEQPVGRGGMGQAWREARPFFADSYASLPQLAPWKSRAERFGLQSVAVLPLFRAGKVWALLSVFHGESGLYDADLRALLTELAANVSRGLDRIDVTTLQNALLENAVVGILLAGQRIIRQCNTRMAAMLGYPIEALVGKSTRLLYASEEEYERVGSAYTRFDAEGSTRVASVKMACRNGQILICDITGKALAGEAEGLSVWTYENVTQREEQTQRLTQLQSEEAYRARHDGLTGLPNRFSLEQHLPRALVRAQRHGTMVAVGMIDLDDFKPVNDSHGHFAGDLLLQEFARRAHERVRASDFIARLGGDEFVVVFEDLEERHPDAQLTPLLERLHQAVLAPFKLGEAKVASLEMSMGLALYPRDGRDADALLRLSDAALYQAKTLKATRRQWWKIGAAAAPPETAEPEIDPYGEEATTLLHEMQPTLVQSSIRFSEAFYNQLMREASAAAILANLSPEEFAALKQVQSRHFAFLQNPGTSREALVTTARHTGKVHALVGISGANMMGAYVLYRSQAHSHLLATPIQARLRFRLTQVIEQRLQEDLQTQLQTMETVSGLYLDTLHRPLPPRGAAWAEAEQALLSDLAQLPGILDVVVRVPDRHGDFQITSRAGAKSENLRNVLYQKGKIPSLDKTRSGAKTLTARAWLSRSIVSAPAYRRDVSSENWEGALLDLGVRSGIAIPILDAQSQPLAVLRLFGAFPNQFESVWMKTFVRGLQQHVQEVWRLCSTPSAGTVVAQDLALIYRDRLFNGGLTLYLQPVVELQTGSVHKVEALARLSMPDGSLILPGVFLPLLSNAELERLFVDGLHQVLAQVTRWNQAHMELSVSINLPPSLLMNPDCATWIEAGLRHFQVPPQQLTLELLETQYIDHAVQDKTILALRRTSVQLVMDDLGAGYSSLKRLTALPFDGIKIDQSLIMGIYSTPVETLGLLTTLILIGKTYGRFVVVEGLEDEGLVEVATLLGARFGQGYGLVRPMAPEAFSSWMNGYSREARQPASIRTYPGALAHAWWHLMHLGASRLPGTLQEGALRPLLERDGLEDSLPARWLERLHSSGDAAEARQAFLAWLVEQVRACPPATAHHAEKASELSNQPGVH